MSKEINRDLGLLLLRLAIGGLMLFHGVAKLISGLDMMKGILAKNGLPEFIAYGVPVGEVLAPLCLIFGVFTRFASLIVAFTMVMSIFLVHKMGAFAIGGSGGPAGELNFLYLLGALAIFFLGTGKYSLFGGNK